MLDYSRFAGVSPRGNTSYKGGVSLVRNYSEDYESRDGGGE